MRSHRAEIRHNQKRLLKRAGGAFLAIAMIGMAAGLIASSILWSQRVDALQNQINLYPNITSVPMWNAFAGYSPSNPFTGNQIQCLGENPTYDIPAVQNCNLTYIQLGDTIDSTIGPTILGFYTITAYKNKTIMSAGFGGELFYASSTFNYAVPYAPPYVATQMAVLIPNAIPAPYRPLLPLPITGTATSFPVTSMASTQFQAILWPDGGMSIGMTFGDTGIPATDGGWKFPVTRFDWVLPALS